MATVPKIGGNQYFATSKDINKMINQLNSVLVSSNLTVAPSVTMGATNTVTIDLSKGNFFNIVLNTASGTNTISFSNITAGVYYFKIKNGQSSTSPSVTFNNCLPSANQPMNSTSLTCTEFFTLVCDGTTFHIASQKNIIT